MPGDDNHYLTMRLIVTVAVDPSDDELLDRFDESSGSLSITEVICAEIESNLESVSYVRQVSVEPIERR